MNSLYGNFRTRTFSDIFPSFSVFQTLYNNGMFPNTTLTTSTLTTLYYLLVAKYKNSHIANSDEEQFKIEVLSTIFKFGGSWQKRLTIQNTLQSMTEADIMKGVEQVSNSAANPGELPITSAGNTIIDAEGNLTYINNQHRTKVKKGLLEGYSILISLLKSDVTTEFIDRFKELFLTIVLPEAPLLYEGGEEEDE